MTSKDSLRMILGAVAGFAAAFAMAGVLIMPPSDMARWIGSDEPVRDRLARVFAPPAHIVELRASAAKASNTLAICKADHEEQRRRADDFEFKLSAAAARPEGAPREAAASCARDYASVRGIKLKVGETVRHLGGRIYLGLESVAGITYQSCNVRVSSDLKWSYGDNILMRIAEPLYVESSMGKFRLIASKHVYNHPSAGTYCEFDLLREP